MVSKNLPKGTKIEQTLNFGGYVKVRESLYTRVIIWVNTNLSPFCLAMKVLAWYVDLNGLENNNFVKHPYPTSYIHIPQRQVLSYCV